MKTAEQCWKTMLNKPASIQATKELARNPLLLTLLCMVYDGLTKLSSETGQIFMRMHLTFFLKGGLAEKRVNRGDVDKPVFGHSGRKADAL